MRSLAPARIYLACALLGVLSLVATACSAGAGNAPTNQGSGAAQQSLDVGLGAAPANLDMTQTAGAAIPQALMYNVYEGLVKLDDQGEIHPLLAESWTISDDRMRYDFVLRSGVTFSNGDPFTAETVKFNLERVPDWKANTPSYLAAIDTVEATSDTEVTIRLKQPDNNLLFWLAGPLGAMFSPDAVENLATEAIGTGPFLLSEFNRGESLIMNRNDSYWGKAAQLGQVTLHYYSDANAPVNALRSGELDVVYQTQAADQVEQFEADDQYKVSIGTTQGIVVMSMNSSRPPFDDVRVRQAIMYGVDREAVNTTASNGYGTVLGAPVPPTDPWYEDLSGQYPYDPDKAKQLLADAGQSDLAVTFKVPSLPYAQTIAQVVKSDLAKVGVDAKLETEEFPAVWLENTFTNHDYDLTVINHVEPRNIVNYGDPDYYWSYDNPDVGKQLDKAAGAPSEQAFTEAMRGVVDTLVADAPGNWLYNAPNIAISTAAVKGLQANDTGVSLDLTAVSNPS
jgi:peptide/nickel transport system substrate-binding protein